MWFCPYVICKKRNIITNHLSTFSKGPETRVLSQIIAKVASDYVPPLGISVRKALMCKPSIPPSVICTIITSPVRIRQGLRPSLQMYPKMTKKRIKKSSNPTPLNHTPPQNLHLPRLLDHPRLLAKPPPVLLPITHALRPAARPTVARAPRLRIRCSAARSSC